MDEILDFEEACSYLKLGRGSMYKIVRSGKIPAFKVGRMWRFKKTMLDAWATECVTTDTTERNKKHTKKCSSVARTKKACSK